MKYLIASDIHGSAYWAERLVAAIESEQPDRIVLLGDLLYHGPRNDLPRDYAPKRVIPLLNALADRIIAASRYRRGGEETQGVAGMGSKLLGDIISGR